MSDTVVHPEFVITRDTSWKAMLGKDERDATEEEP
jgi:hypothetical protein